MICRFLVDWDTLVGSTVHKNELQMFCQRKRITMPTYTLVKFGPDHAPGFQAVVEVDGKHYESEGDYSTKGGPEQAAAKVAFDILCSGNTFWTNQTSDVGPYCSTQSQPFSHIAVDWANPSQNAGKCGRMYPRPCTHTNLMHIFSSAQIYVRRAGWIGGNQCTIL